jgi:hypothetical protein
MIKFFFAGVILLSQFAFAQEPPIPSEQVTTKVTTSSKERRATINFEDELVEGGTQKPELFYLFQKKNFNYGRLIKLRENFLPEMRKTTEDVQRVRSRN